MNETAEKATVPRAIARGGNAMDQSIFLRALTLRALRAGRPLVAQRIDLLVTENGAEAHAAGRS